MRDRFLTDTRTDAALIGDLAPDESWTLVDTEGDVMVISSIGATLLVTLNGDLKVSKPHGPDLEHTAVQCAEGQVAQFLGDGDWRITAGRPVEPQIDPIRLLLAMMMRGERFGQ